MADASIKLASAIDGFADTDTMLEMNGFDKAARKRIRRELREVRGQNVLDQMMADRMSEVGDEDQTA
jgi:hypothetical protein